MRFIKIARMGERRGLSYRQRQIRDVFRYLLGAILLAVLIIVWFGLDK